MKKVLKGIVKGIKMVPGYIILVPLLLGIIINFAIPAESLDSYSETVRPIWTALLMILVFGICSQLNFRKLGKGFKRGGILLGIKLGMSLLVGVIVYLIFGLDGFWGISVLVIVAAMSNCNTALFAGLSDKSYGEEEDNTSIMTLALTNGTAFTTIFMVTIMAIAGISESANVEVFQVILPLIPMVLGVLVGNLWPKIQPVLYKVCGICLPLFGLILGTTIRFMDAVDGGLQGLVLGAMTLILTGGVAWAVSRFYMGKKKFSPMAAGIGTTAGNAVGTPAYLGEGVAVACGTRVAVATAQITGSLIITAIFAPVLVALLFRWEAKRREKLGIEQIVTVNEVKQKELKELKGKSAVKPEVAEKPETETEKTETAE